MSVAGLHYSSHANRPGTNAARPNCQSYCYYWKGYLVGILQVHAARSHYSHKFKRIVTVTKPIRVDQPLLFHQKSNFRCTPSLQVLFQFLHLLKIRTCNFFYDQKMLSLQWLYTNFIQLQYPLMMIMDFQTRWWVFYWIVDRMTPTSLDKAAEIYIRCRKAKEKETACWCSPILC